MDLNLSEFNERTFASHPFAKPNRNHIDQHATLGTRYSSSSTMSSEPLAVDVSNLSATARLDLKRQSHQSETQQAIVSQEARNSSSKRYKVASTLAHHEPPD